MRQLIVAALLSLCSPATDLSAHAPAQRAGAQRLRTLISVDEKPSIQALSRTTGYVRTSSGKIVRRLKSTYRRNGTLNLFASLRSARDSVVTAATVLALAMPEATFSASVVPAASRQRAWA